VFSDQCLIFCTGGDNLGHYGTGPGGARADEPIIGQTRIAGREMPIRRFGIPPNRDASGEIEQMGLLAGQGVGLVAEILRAADLVRKIADEARIVIAQRLGQPQV
jgi:NAD(P)H-dependent flavin oxidoreductase YrpB (nitropropane dioxygenase family)